MSAVAAHRGPTCFERSRYDAASKNSARVVSEVANEEPPFDVIGSRQERSTGSLLKESICYRFAHAIDLWDKNCMFVCVGIGSHSGQIIWKS